MMNPIEKFCAERISRLGSYADNPPLLEAAHGFLVESIRAQYSYNFEWLSRPVIQYPQDIVAMQELIWRIKPDLVIETGIAHGGSLILSASMLAMIDYCEAVERRELLDPQATRRRVLGVDIDIRPHNRSAIAAHPMSHRIDMIQGSSIAPDIIQQVREIAGRHERVLVCLDSNHTHAHVLAELEAYAPLTSQGSYCCVFDTVIEDLPRDMYPERPWTVGDNPKTAVEEYLRTIALEGRASLDGSSLKFTVDDELQRKLLVTAAPSGYLKRI